MMFKKTKVSKKSVYSVVVVVCSIIVDISNAVTLGGNPQNSSLRLNINNTFPSSLFRDDDADDLFATWLGVTMVQS